MSPMTTTSHPAVQPAPADSNSLASQPANGSLPAPTRKPALQICKFCGDWVNLNEEGNTYRDGTAVHEDCHDSHQFQKENASDFRN